ncbi:hypothetical protein D3C80_693060 [compost metagenome]
MQLEADIHFEADGLADPLDELGARLHLRGMGAVMDAVGIVHQRIEMADGGKSLLLAHLRLLDEFVGAASLDPGVKTDAVTHAAAEQLVDGYAQRLALDIPERHVDGGYRAVDRRTRVVVGAQHHIPVPFDRRRVLPFQKPPEALDGGGGGIIMPPSAALAVADNALVSGDAHEQENVREYWLDRCDFHVSLIASILSINSLENGFPIFCGRPEGFCSSK